MNRDEGVTIVMVTHNLDIVSATDRVVRMVGGVVTEDTPAAPPSSLSAAVSSGRVIDADSAIRSQSA